MAYRGGGRGGGDRDRGDQCTPYGHGGAGGGGGRSGSFVWPPPATTPHPVPAQYQMQMGYRAPMVLPHQVAYGPPAAVHRAPATPQVSFSPAPPAAQVTIRAPPPSATPAPSSSAPSPRHQVAPASSAPSPAALAKVEKKLFVSETALAPPAAVASAAVAAAQGADAEDGADVDLAPFSKKGLAHPARPGLGTAGKSVMIRANHFLVDVADNNLYHYDKMINGGTIDNWTCLNYSCMRPEEVQRFCMDLTHMCNATGMSVNPRPFVEVKSAAPNHIENALRDVHRRATQMLAQQGTGNQLHLLIVILPDVSGSYGKIRRACETEIGIVSQCCLPKHASRPNKQYLENVALKVNVKVGERNTVLERAFVRNGIPYVSEVPTIIFGADVTHPPPGEDSASSISAVVASMDWPEITKYRGLVSAQPHRQEIIEDLFAVSKDPQKGHNVNGGMIRDGASEGQFSHVLLHEMDAIRKACASDGRIALGGKLPAYDGSTSSIAAVGAPPVSVGNAGDSSCVASRNVLTNRVSTKMAATGLISSKIRKNILNQGGAFGKVVVWLLCILYFVGTSQAQVSKVPCDNVGLAKKIKAYCINSTAPNGMCCMAVTNAIERKHGEPCVCNVLKAGVKANKVIEFYYKCGGKRPSVAELISLCAGAPPPPPAQGGSVPPRARYPTWFTAAVVLLGLLALGLVGLVVYKFLKLKAQQRARNQQGHSFEMTSTRSSVIYDIEAAIWQDVKGEIQETAAGKRSRPQEANARYRKAAAPVRMSQPILGY